MVYWMLRLFLSDRLKGTLFDQPDRRPPISREDHLRSSFGREVRFPHRRQRYVFTPYGNVSGTGILLGLVAKEHRLTIAKSPEEHYEKELVEDWDTANIFIDVEAGSDGQKIAMQFVPSVGSPLSVLQSLVRQVNISSRESDWLIAVNAISPEAGFWEIVQRYRGKISEIDLKFAAPNIWGGDSETEKALKELHNVNGVEQTEVKLKNSEGNINPGEKDGRSRIASSVDFIRKGGGSLKVKSSRRTIYDSEKAVETQTPPRDSAVQDVEKEVASALARWLLGKR